jgi:hypothetical protein
MFLSQYKITAKKNCDTSSNNIHNEERFRSRDLTETQAAASVYVFEMTSR